MWLRLTELKWGNGELLESGVCITLSIGECRAVFECRFDFECRRKQGTVRERCLILFVGDHREVFQGHYLTLILRDSR